MTVDNQITPEPAPSVRGEMKAEDCVVSIGSQRVCAHGTLGCVNHHAPSTHVAGNRWRAFEDTTPGYWGIELEYAGNDDDAIMFPIKIHRDTVTRIVDAHNALLAQATAYKPRSVGFSVLADNPTPSQHVMREPDLTMLLLSKAEGIRTEFQLAYGRPCDCSTPESALQYGRAQGLEIAAEILGTYPSSAPMEAER